MALALLATFTIGLCVPDLDQWLPLGHRSALTHSLLPVLLALLHPERRLLAPGLSIGIGAHLAADSFPNAMVGFATVKVPGIGALSAQGSYIWLGSQAMAAVAIGAVLTVRVLPRRWALLVLALIAAGCSLYLFVTDGGWPVLALCGLAGGIGWRLRRQSSG